MEREEEIRLLEQSLAKRQPTNAQKEIELLERSLARKKSSSQEMQESNIGKQAAAGIIPGLTSIADLPALGYNALTTPVDYLFEKVTGRELPAEQKEGIPYYGHEFGANIANKLVGTPQTEAEEYARLGGEVAGGFLSPGTIGSIAAKPIKEIGKFAAQKLSGISPQKYETFQKAGITPTLSEVSKYQPIEKVQRVIEQAPWGAGKMEKFALEREKELNHLFSEIGEINKAKSISQTGELTKKGAVAYNEKAQSVASKLYDKAWKGVDKNAAVPMPNTHKTIRESLSAISESARRRLAESPTGRELLKIEDDIIENKGTLPFGDIKSVYKKDIDKGVKLWEGVADVDQAILKRISGALKQDMDDFVLQHNPKAANDLKKADKFYSNYSERNRDIANKAAKETDPIKTFNGLVSDLKGGDYQPAKVIMQRLKPEDKKIFSATFLNELGRGANGDFDAMKWAKELNKLRPESRNTALSGFPKAQTKHIEEIANAISLTKSENMTPGINYVMTLLGGAINPLLPVKAAVASRMGAEIFTNPKITNALYEASKASDPIKLEKILAKHSILPRMEIIREENKREETGPYRKKEMQGFVKESPALKAIARNKTDEQELKAFREILQNMPTIE